jgi:hypothetical protein
MSARGQRMGVFRFELSSELGGEVPNLAPVQMTFLSAFQLAISCGQFF